jgi:hypothetical protein
MDGGTNPLRYGGSNSNGTDVPAFGFSIPQASIVIDAAVHPNAKIHLQTNYSSDASTGTSHLAIVEAYAQASAAVGQEILQVRAGGFIPSISWEHPDPAWSTRYTLTPSAIGSWISEEIRVLGVQGSWEHPFAEGDSARLTAGAFSGGDQIGRMLWFRGWSLDDYQGGLDTKYTIQSHTYSPSVDMDGRLGYFGRGDLNLFNHLVELGGGYWTNNADDRLGQPGLANVDTQAFRTSLFHYGGKIEYQEWTLISQYLKATVSAVSEPARDWESAYVLGSVHPGEFRLSARYDRFWSNGWDNGFAFTEFVAWDFSLRQQVGLEYICSNARPNQATRPAAEVDRLAQLNYRLRF